MEKPLISVIIPAFNYAHLVEETIQSVIAQSYSYWEIWVIDDGSTDATKATIQEIARREPRVKYYYQENRGLPVARNTGFQLSKGKYIQFLDADDLIHKSKFSEQIEIMESDPTIDVCYTNFRWFRDTLDNLTPRYGVNLELSENPFEDFLLRWDNELIIPIHAALFRRDIWHDSQPFNEQLRAKEDWFMWCTLARNGKKFFFYNQDYAYYRLHGQNMCADLIHMTTYFVRATYYLTEIVPDNLKEMFYQANQMRLDKLINLMLSQNSVEITQILTERDAHLAEIQSSKVWRFALLLRKVRVWLAPDGSWRLTQMRKVYSTIKRLAAGLKSFC